MIHQDHTIKENGTRNGIEFLKRKSNPMKSNLNKNEIVIGIVEFILGMLLIGGIVYGVWVAIQYHNKILKEKMISDTAHSVAKESLRKQISINENHDGINYDCTFVKNEEANVATVVYDGGKTHTCKDYNKSLIVGKYVGEKSKEMVKGLFQGLKTKGKHDD